mgnify:CR=1 FL=1
MLAVIEKARDERDSVGGVIEVVARGGPERADRAKKGGGVRDDVSDRARDEAANGDDRRVTGTDLAADERVQGGCEVRAGDDRVDAEVRPRGVHAPARERDLEAVGGRVLGRGG